MRTHIAIIALLVAYTLANGCSVPTLQGYNICDQRWANIQYGPGSLCRISAPILSNVASALAYLGKQINGRLADPGNLSQYLASRGISNYDWSWSAISSLGVQLELNVDSLEKVKSAICQGKVVILKGFMNSNILVKGYDNDGFTVFNTLGKQTRYPASLIRADIIWGA